MLQAVVAAGLVASFWLVGDFAATSHKGFDWNAATGAATAYGTLALALVTWRLVNSTRQDARGTLRLARLAEREQGDKIIPFVYPITDRRWIEERSHLHTLIAVRNGASGVALNVSGQMYWHSGNAEMTCATLAGGDHATVHLGSPVPSWDGLWGSLFYLDIEGRQWETRFKYEQRPDGRIRAQVCVYGVDLPREAYPAGWEMPPGGVPRVYLPNR